MALSGLEGHLSEWLIGRLRANDQQLDLHRVFIRWREGCLAQLKNVSDPNA
jgi:hypothetical protein